MKIMSLLLLGRVLGGSPTAHAFSARSIPSIRRSLAVPRPSSRSLAVLRPSPILYAADSRHVYDPKEGDTKDNSLEKFLSSISYRGSYDALPSPLSPMISQAFNEFYNDAESVSKVPKRLYLPISENTIAVNDFSDKLCKVKYFRKAGWGADSDDDWGAGKPFGFKHDEYRYGTEYEGIISRVVTARNGWRLKRYVMDTRLQLFPYDHVIMKWQILRQVGSDRTGPIEKAWFDTIQSAFENLGATCHYEEIGLAAYGRFGKIYQANIREGGENGYEIMTDDEWLVRNIFFHHKTWGDFVLCKKEAQNRGIGQVTIVPGMEDKEQSLYSGYALVVELPDSFYETVGIKTSDIHSWPYNGKLTEKQQLFKAAKEGHTEDVEKMLEKKLSETGTSPDAVADFCTSDVNPGWTLLHEAAKNNQTAIIELLLQEKYGMDVNSYFVYTESWVGKKWGPEQFDCIFFGSGDWHEDYYIKNERLYPYDMTINHSVKRQLLAYGANPNAKKKSTFLAWAIGRKDLEEVRMLLEAGADMTLGPKYRDNHPLRHVLGDTIGEDDSPIIFEIIKLLLEHGADIYKTSDEEEGQLNFLSVALYEGHYELLSRLLPAEIETPTPKKEKQRYGIKDIAKLLEEKDDKGKTILFHAVWNGLEFVKLFLERGANVHATDDQNRTPLHYASYGRTPEVYDLLLEYGADETKPDKDNVLPTRPSETKRSETKPSERARGVLRAPFRVLTKIYKLAAGVWRR